jgi:hypothetical protein
VDNEYQHSSKPPDVSWQFMVTQLLILFISFLTIRDRSANSGSDKIQNIVNDQLCKTEFDTMTMNKVYITADILPKNEGGQSALMQRLSKISLSVIPENYDPNYLVAFIVEKDGSIKGERIIRDKTNQVGKQMLDIVRSFKWTPGKCNNKNVRMLYKLPLIIDIAFE